MTDWLPPMFLVLGACVFVYGVWRWSEAAALVVAGAGMIALGVGIYRGGSE